MIDLFRQIIANLSLALIFISLAITVLNLLTIRRPRDSKPISKSIAVFIPMRNEERNALECVEAILKQDNLNDLRVFAIDDGSTDRTSEILGRILDSRFEFRSGNALPEGWLGKNFALHTIAKSSDAEYFVFVDADVRLAPNALVTSINLMERVRLDYLSPYPKQIADSLLERLVQPLLQWSWFASLPLRLVERSLRPSTVVANGQFLIVRGEAYRISGGHESVRDEVLDDIELARSLRKSGFRGTVVNGTQISNCRMYENRDELLAGYLKSQWRAFGSFPGALLAISILALVAIVPLTLALSGSNLGLLSYLVAVLTRLLVAIPTKSSLISPWFHPFAILLWIFLILRSIYLHRTGSLSWRGRAL